MIKKKVCSIFFGMILAVSLTFFCVGETVEFKKDDVTVKLQESFVMFTPETVDSMTFEAAKFDLSTDRIKQSMKNSNCLFLAMSKELQCTVLFSQNEDETSKAIGDLYKVTDKTVTENAKRLILGSTLNQAQEIKEIEKNGALFYRIKYNDKNSASSVPSDTSSANSSVNSDYTVMYNVTGTSAAVVYATVMNGKTYVLTLLDGTGSLGERSNDVIDWIFENMTYTVQYSQTQVDTKTNTLQTVLRWVSVGVGVILVVLLVVSIVSDIKLKRVDGNRKRIVKKKPRR